MKKMKSLVIVLSLYCTTMTYGQVNTRLSLIQGIWEYSIDTETGSIFKIVDGEKCLEFTYRPESDTTSHPLFKMIVGFQDLVSSSDDVQEIDIDSFKADGLYYTEIINEKYVEEDSLVKKPNYIIPFYFESDGLVMSINGGKLFEYEKIHNLPYKVMQYLYNRGKHDGQNYIKEYLNLKVLEVKPVKCIVYSEPNKPTKIQLKRGDVVIVIEETGKWLKIKLDENSIGWIKKEDTK